ncbi:hypothetical protein [Thermocatellispora tengchongensis]|uniref:hypothetical protein n=1 Tax=Thermocatellispora tengchongensis TaxID=1073253 RepID=UPI00362BB10D
MRGLRLFTMPALLLAITALSACSVSATPGGSTAGASEKATGPVAIGFSQATQQSPFYVQLREGRRRRPRRRAPSCTSPTRTVTSPSRTTTSRTSSPVRWTSC